MSQPRSQVANSVHYRTIFSVKNSPDRLQRARFPATPVFTWFLHLQTHHRNSRNPQLFKEMQPVTQKKSESAVFLEPEKQIWPWRTALGTHSAPLYSFVSVAAAFLFSAPPSLDVCVPRYTAGTRNTGLFHLNPPDCWSYTWYTHQSLFATPTQNKLPLPPRGTIVLLLRGTGLISNFSLPTCRGCWVNWEQFWEVRWPRKKGGWEASIAESGPGRRNLWVTLKSMRGSPCIDDEALLLTTAEGLWREEKGTD